jgi:hypothetical protein
MKKPLLLLLLAFVLAATFTACKSSPRGDREFIPGQGWEPVK